jgi:ribosomal protein S12 methylthiotransferase accessory factor
MEGVELFHAERIDGRTRIASFTELSAMAPVLDPKALCGSGPPLSDRTKIAWIEGYDLLNREPCWAPWDVVHTDFTLPVSHASAHFRSGSNGLASGNHLLEALSSGLCELVERDAVALWHAKPIAQRATGRLDLDSVDDESCCALLARYAAAGIVPKVWDVTSDIGIAAFICDIPAAHGNPDLGLRRFRGSGCHADRTVALARALTEAAQVRLTYIAGIRDDIPLADYEETAGEKLGAALLDAASEAGVPRSFGDVPHLCTDDLADDVQCELQRLRAVGVDRVIAVDLSRADIRVPVARIVVPGLEWDCSQRSYAPGPRARRPSGLVQ